MYYIILRLYLDLMAYIFGADSTPVASMDRVDNTPTTVKSIDKHWVQAQLAFGATSIKIPEGVTLIENRAF
jgi:hypothetical protein